MNDFPRVQVEEDNYFAVEMQDDDKIVRIFSVEKDGTGLGMDSTRIYPQFSNDRSNKWYE